MGFKSCANPSGFLLPQREFLSIPNRWDRFGLGRMEIAPCFWCQHFRKRRNVAVKIMLGLFPAGEWPGCSLSVDYTRLTSPEAGYSIFQRV